MQILYFLRALLEFGLYWMIEFLITPYIQILCIVLVEAHAEVMSQSSHGTAAPALEGLQ